MSSAKEREGVGERMRVRDGSVGGGEGNPKCIFLAAGHFFFRFSTPQRSPHFLRVFFLEYFFLKKVA